MFNRLTVSQRLIFGFGAIFLILAVFSCIVFLSPTTSPTKRNTRLKPEAPWLKRPTSSKKSLSLSLRVRPRNAILALTLEERQKQAEAYDKAKADFVSIQGEILEFAKQKDLQKKI